MNAERYVQTIIRGNELLKQHNLSDEWTFDISSHKTFVGMCYHNKKRIVISHYFLHNDPVEIENTILHEIAHALAGPNHHHDDYWKHVARSIGCVATRCAAPSVKSAAKHRYVIKCPNGCRKWERFKRPAAKMHRSRCPICKATVQVFQYVRR